MKVLAQSKSKGPNLISSNIPISVTFIFDKIFVFTRLRNRVSSKKETVETKMG